MLSFFCIGGEDGFDDAPSQGIITATGAVAFTALLSLSIDALVSGAQAIHANRAHESSFKSAQASSDRSDAFQWTVTATPVISGSNGVTGASMGIAGIFQGSGDGAAKGSRQDPPPGSRAVLAST